jgi:hypothetical protein
MNKLRIRIFVDIIGAAKLLRPRKTSSLLMKDYCKDNFNEIIYK